MKTLIQTLLLSFTLFSLPASASSQLPDQVLLDLDGNPQPLTQWQGKVVVLNFWATWCPPCRRELPAFVEVQKEYGSEGVQFVGVAVDNAKIAKRYSEEQGLNFPSLQGESQGLELSVALGNQRSVLPYTVIFDRDGKIVSQRRGEIKHKELIRTIIPLL